MSTRGTQTNPARLPGEPSSGVYNSSAPTLNNGDQTSLQLDVNGNLKVTGGGGGGGNASVAPTGATVPADATFVGAEDTNTGDLVGLTSTEGALNTNADIFSTFIGTAAATWTSATSLNTELDSTAEGSAASFTLVQTGTLSTGAVTFEQTADGTNWAPILLIDNTTNIQVAGYTFISGVNRTFSTGFSTLAVRARLSTAITGSGSVLITQDTYAIAAEQQTAVELTDGTNIIGTSTHPVRVDPTGTTTQPVSVAATLSDNIAQWGGTAVSAPPASGVPAAGTEVAPVVKPIQRVNTAFSTTTPLAANGVYTSAWIDREQTGANFVNVEYTSNVGFASVQIQETDNTGDSTFRVIASQTTPGANTLWSRSAIVRARYWRVVATNGGTLQTTFELTATESSVTSPLMVLTGTGMAFVQGGTAVAGGSGSTDIVAPMLCTSTLGVTTEANTVGSANIYATLSTSGVGGNLGMVAYGVTDGTTGGGQAALRTPNVFKTVQATSSGNTALWTPTSGKKFRLMRFIVDLTSNAAQSSAGVVTVSFQDATTALNVAFDVYVPGTAVTSGFGGYTSGWIDLGNGYISTTANNVLNVNLNTAITTGNVRVTCCGTEE